MYVQGHPEGEAVKITSDPKDPLVIALAEALKLVGVDIQGISLINPDEFLNVKIVGGSTGGAVAETDAVDIIDLLPGTQVRSATATNITLPDLKKYKRYTIQVINGLDQDVKIAPWSTAPVVFEDGTTGYFATTATNDNVYSWTVQKKDANSTGMYFLNMMEPKSNGAGTMKVKDPARLFETMFSLPGVLMVLAYKAVAVPTTGSLTIRLIGFKR